MADRKVLAEIGVAVVCEFLKAAIQTADNAGDAVTQLSQATNQAVSELVAALNRERPCAVAFTANVSDWKANTEEDTSSVFAYAYDIEVQDVTTEELAFIVVSPGSASTAKACRLGLSCRTLAGVIRLYAKQRPTGSITGEYWIVNGRAASEESGESGTGTEGTEAGTGTETEGGTEP